MRAEAVLFDVDGTLLDTVPLIVETHQHAFRTWLGHPGDIDSIMASIGTPLEDFFLQVAPDLVEPLLQTYLEFNEARLDTHVGIFREAVPMLQKLHDLGIPLGVVTSKRRDAVMHSLHSFGLAKYFQVLISKETTSRHKPDPEPALEALRQLKLNDPGRVIFVGDSVHDLYCAQRAGCRSAIVGWTAMPVEELRAAGPDLWLENADQLADFAAGI